MDGASSDTQPNAVLADLALRLGAPANPRLAACFLALVSRMHDLIGALHPTNDEFRAMIDFLTEVGHTTDARRQEWVLLADVIGASTLVEEINSVRPPGATPNTLPGPFYRADMPDLPAGTNLSRDGIGEPLQVTLRLRDLAGQPVRQAQVEVWHANASGRYENQDPDLQPEFNLRGRLRSDAEGIVRFDTIRPRGYSLPSDGPVGRLLASLGLRLERPAHLHVRVSAPGFQTLTTHIFDRQDPAIGHDALFGVRPELLADFCPVHSASAGPTLLLDHCLYLAPEAPGAATGAPTPSQRKEN
jgi:protocatechuate 3,4-dioxygenase beta subunit